MLLEYDKVIQKIIKNKRVIICTGLTQTRVDKTVFYYRLRNHSSFLKEIGIDFINIEPRMSRDFLIKFSSDLERNKAYKKLSNIYVDGKIKLFGLIDKRKYELFVTLDYPLEILDTTYITDENSKNLPLSIKKMVALVAIKNGAHMDKCFLFADQNLPDPRPMNGSHCKNIFQYILKEFPKSKIYEIL